MTESDFGGPETEIPCALMIGFPMSWVHWKALAETNKMIFGSSRLAYLLQKSISGYQISNGDLITGSVFFAKCAIKN